MKDTNLNILISDKTKLEYDIKDLIIRFLYDHKDLNLDIDTTVSMEKFELGDGKIVSVPIVKIKIVL